MRELNLDGYPDAVKDFVRELVTKGDSVALVLEGHTLLIAVPVPPDEDDGPWTAEKHARQHELVKKELGGNLAVEEIIELNRLTRALRREVRRLAPLPLDDAHELFTELLRKAQAATKGD